MSSIRAAAGLRPGGVVRMQMDMDGKQNFENFFKKGKIFITKFLYQLKKKAKKEGKKISTSFFTLNKKVLVLI
jgi:hypothetical protein